MFNEVRILDATGKVKNVVSSKVLSRRYWKSFFDSPVLGAPAKNTKERPITAIQDKKIFVSSICIKGFAESKLLKSKY